MMVGRTMSGKSVAWKTLAQAKTDLGKEDKLEGYHPVHRSGAEQLFFPYRVYDSPY